MKNVVTLLLTGVIASLAMPEVRAQETLLEEIIVTARKRSETLEETGYTAPTWRHVGTVAPNPAIHGNRLFTWLAEGAVQAQAVHPDEGEVITTFTAAWPEVLAMLRDGRIDHALVVAGFAHLAFAGRLG